MSIEKIPVMNSCQKNVSKNLGHSKILGLITAREAESLLVDLANLQLERAFELGVTEHGDLDQFLRRHAEHVADKPDPFRELREFLRKHETGDQALETRFLRISRFFRLRELVRKAWDAPDRRSREWYAFTARLAYRCEILNEQEINWPFEPTVHPTTDIDALMTGEEAFKPLIELEKATVAGDPRAIQEYLDNLREEVDAFCKIPPPTKFEAALYYLQTIVADRARHCQNDDCKFPYFIVAKRWQKYCSNECAVPAQRAAKRLWWATHRGKGSI